MLFEEKILLADAYLTQILSLLEVKEFGKTIYFSEDGILKIDINGQDLDFLVENNGKVLNELQYIIVLLVNNIFENHLKIILDYDNFREKRNLQLRELSRKFVEKVLKNGGSVTLEPMNPYERRLIHSYVSEYFGVYSKSIGKDPNRSVVIYKEEK